MQREHPEIFDKISDMDVFKFLFQFLRPEDVSPALQNVKETLPKLEEKEKREREERIEKEAKIHKILGPVLPGIFDDPELNDESKLQKDDLPYMAALAPPFLKPENLWEISLSPEAILDNVMTKEQFLDGKDMTNPEIFDIYERQWTKYQELVEITRKKRVSDPTPEVEPIIESSEDHRKIFRQSSIGKYIRFSARDQKKYFPEGWTGKLEEREFKSTNETSLLLRQSAMDVISQLQEGQSSFFSNKAIKPIILYGDKGVGKSAVLQTIVYWARKSDWLVINIKSGLKWCHSGLIIQKSKLLPGCWDQPYLGVRFLSALMDVHHDKLRNIPIRTNINMGKFKGKTLYDLVEYGAALHEYSCETVYHLKKELQCVIEYPVLVTVDDYNIFYNYNQVFRDPECPHFKPRKLRNYFLTLTQIFYDMHRDPKLIHGAFVGALSGEITYRYFPVPHDAPCQWKKVEPFSVYETHKVFDHYQRTQYIQAQTTQNTREIIHQLCDGRGREIARFCQSI